MSNIVMVAGQPLDIDSLPLQGQKELVSFFDFLTFKFKQNEPAIATIKEEKIPTMEELFDRFQGRLPADYQFDREEIYADRV